MTKVVIRRSYRLKDKPAPKYDYPSILQLTIEAAEAERVMEESKVQSKKLKQDQKEAARNKKYDDIFSSVVKNAYKIHAQQTSAGKRRAERTEEHHVVQKQRRKNSETDGEMSSDSDKDANEEEDDEIQILEVEEVIETDEEPFKCGCGRRFEQHMDCHRHMFADHADNDLNAECLTCGRRTEAIRNQHVCEICGEFALELQEHLASHYRNCTAKTAVMECRYCTRQFWTVKEVMEHEKQKHLIKTVRKVPLYYKCNECPEAFASQETLAMHYAASHINVYLLCDRLAQLQDNIQAVNAECPFCRDHMASRKSFRAHVLKQHYAACKSLIAMSPGQLTLSLQRTDEQLKKDVEELTKGVGFGSAMTVKQELKEEVHDEGYPAC